MKLGVPLTVKYDSEVNVTLVDSRTGKVDKKVNLGSNMILAEHYEEIFKNEKELLPYFSEVKVGDDDTAPALSQTGLQGNEIDSSTDKEETVEIDDMYRDWPAILPEFTCGDSVNSVAWSSDDSKIASGDDDGTVHVFDADTGDKILEYDGHSGSVNSVAWSSDDSKIVSGSQDYTVHIFDADNGDKILEYDGHSGVVNSVAWSSDDSKIASGDDDGTVYNYKVQKESGDLFDTISRGYTFYFPASESGVGNIKEFYNDAGARITYSDGIDKKEYHEMYVEWVWTVELSDREFTGTITDGQRDGETDINYKISIDNRQFIDLCQENNLLTDSAVVGTSNDDNDLVEDVKDPILGEEIFDGSLWHHETEDYVDDSYEREWRIGFEYDEANHEDGIGEILLGSRDNPLIRITFDPPLDKIYDDNNQWRLYLDFLAIIDPDAQTSSIDVVEEE